MSALATIQKTFPQVKKVIDARRSIRVSVTENDCSAARKKDPNSCALARACIREKLGDAAIIGISTCYLIKGDRAIRFKTSETIAREITSFDRHHDFAAGNDYTLSKIAPRARLGTALRVGTGKPRAHGAPKMRHHQTINIRKLRQRAA